MDEKLKSSIRAILYREGGKSSVSHILSCLRNKGWKKLGPGENFAQLCEQAGFPIEHMHREENGVRITTRTFVCLPEWEIA